MAKRKGKDQTEALDNFLQYKFYHDAYEELTDKDSRYFELFAPLEFCQVFCQMADMIENNKAKPTALSRQLKNNLTLLYGEIPLTDEQRQFFYYKLLDWFENVRREDEQIDICCREIEKLQKNLDVAARQPAAAARQPAQDNRFDFEKVKQHLETLPDDKARVLYLDELKTEYEQADTGNTGWEVLDWGGISFSKQCDLEIKKLERRIKLERSGSKPISKEKRAKGGTHYQNLLAMYYMLHYLRADGNATSKAKFASFLTGFSEHTFRQQWSTVHWKKDKDGVAWEDDMKIVRSFFRELGLPEVVKIIDNDLNF